MRAPSWAAILVQRLILFLIGALLITLMLHVPQGLKQTGPPGAPATFDVRGWLESGAGYLGRLLRGDPGILLRLGPPGFREDQPVARVIAAQAPRSLYLMSLALLIALAGGTLLGLASSRFGSWRWRGAALAVVMLMLSTPDILLAVGLRRFAIWGMDRFGWRLLDPLTVEITWSDAILPALALGALPVALVARTAAVAFDEVYHQLYIRTAVAKGLTNRQVIWRHAFRNAWLRVAEVGPLVVGSLVTGLVIVELIFYYPGLGRTLGMILEKGLQPQAATAISLTLMAAAMAIEALLAASRTWLDPRLRGQTAEWRLPSLTAVLARRRIRKAEARPAAAAAPGWSLRERLAEAWASLGRLVWFLRPSRLLRELWRSPALLLGLVGVAGLFYLAIFGSELADLRASSAMRKYVVHDDRVYFPPYPPGLPGYPLGSDLEGRDMLSRILVGARYTIFFTLAVTPVRFLVALPWGLLAGLRRGGWATLSRSLSLVTYAVPVVLIPAALLPLRQLAGEDPLSDSSFWTITAILAVGGIPRLVESIRMQVEAILVEPFLEGAHAVGAEPGRILRRHIVPHLAPQLWVTAATDMAWTLLLLAQLGVFSIFVGGAAFQTAYLEPSLVPIPRVPDWSSMLARPYEVVHRAPWALFFPALAFLLAIAALNLTAEGLRKRLQSFVSTPALPEVEALPDGRERIARPVRRRLALEWSALAAALVLVGSGLVYAHRSTGVAELSPLERARLEAVATIEVVFGTGTTRERLAAVAELGPAVSAYLVEARNHRLSPVDIQQDLHGRANVFRVTHGPVVVDVYLPPLIRGEVDEPGHVFILDPQSGRVTHFANKVQAFSVGSPREGVLVISGPIPGTPRWGLTTWSRRGGAWERDEEAARALLGSIPPAVEPALTAPNQIELGAGSVQVGEDGAITVCRLAPRQCQQIAWPR